MEQVRFGICEPGLLAGRNTYIKFTGTVGLLFPEKREDPHTNIKWKQSTYFPFHNWHHQQPFILLIKISSVK